MGVLFLGYHLIRRLLAPSLFRSLSFHPLPPPTESLALFLSFVDNMDIYNHTTRYT